MRKVLASMLVILSCSFGVSEAIERFVTFPAIGTCTGTYVRYREDPDTDSEILGRLNKPDRVIVLGQTATDGQVWYEIESPEDDSTAWVFGKYIVPVFGEVTQQTELYPLVVNIMQNYGITPSKAKLYSGPNPKSQYRNNHLVYLEVASSGNSFGELSIGDTEQKLIDTLGIPDMRNGTECDYRAGKDFRLVFDVRNGKIARMSFQE